MEPTHRKHHHKLMTSAWGCWRSRLSRGQFSCWFVTAIKWLIALLCKWLWCGCLVELSSMQDELTFVEQCTRSTCVVMCEIKWVEGVSRCELYLYLESACRSFKTPGHLYFSVTLALLSSLFLPDLSSQLRKSFYSRMMESKETKTKAKVSGLPMILLV